MESKRVIFTRVDPQEYFQFTHWFICFAACHICVAEHCHKLSEKAGEGAKKRFDEGGYGKLAILA
jgi:hypothetical protein